MAYAMLEWNRTRKNRTELTVVDVELDGVVVVEVVSEEDQQTKPKRK